jgi:hypothetical protein
VVLGVRRLQLVAAVDLVEVLVDYFKVSLVLYLIRLLQ